MGGFLVSYEPAAVDPHVPALYGWERAAFGQHAAAWVTAERRTGMTTVCVRVDRGVLVMHGDRLADRPRPPAGAVDAVLGWAATAMSRWCCALCEPDALTLWTDPGAACPLVYALHPSGAPAAATAAKGLADVVAGGAKMVELAGDRVLWAPGRCGFEGLGAVPPGARVRFVRAGGSWAVDEQPAAPAPPEPSETDEDAARRRVHRELERAVARAVTDCDEVGVTISGGVDSASVAAFARPRVRRMCTYTVGTPYGDEFAAARRTAGLVASEHRELTMTAADLRELLPSLIWHMETWDPLTLQIAAPVAFLYRRLAADAPRVMLTGYGADLLFGGALDPLLSEPEVERAVVESVAATTRTNELSPALAESLGITVRYPYWDPALVRAALSIRGRLKLRDGTVKHVLRGAVEPLLPPDVAWRPKSAIHEGCRMDRLFAEVLGTGDARAQASVLREWAGALFAAGSPAPRVAAGGIADRSRECAYY
jgi:carbapenam-3-carboxylate synthase